MEFFRTEKVTERITRIFGLGGELMYLLEGDKKAALIDTGVGEGNLAEFVRTLTDKEIIVLITHCHIDHAMGCKGFQHIYMNPLDAFLYDRHKSVEDKKNFLLAAKYPAEVMKEHSQEVLDTLTEEPMFSYLPLRDGDRFDIGGLHISIYEVAGHTPGSVVMLIEEERLLLLGDDCNYVTYLFLEQSSPCIEVYQQNLKKLEERVVGKFDAILLSHRDGNAPKELLYNVISLCDDIMQGKTDDVPYQAFRGKGILAKAVNDQRRRLDGVAGNIVYQKDKVFEKIKGFILVLDKPVPETLRKEGFCVAAGVYNSQAEFPDPEPLCDIAEQMGLETSACAVVTDRLAVIDAAKAAGAKTIGIDGASGYARTDISLDRLEELIDIARCFK